ncbi:zinc finger protein GAI-ASSOCIATED FACTOR 1 [Ricinus communis]|uniref:Nucleic acid binding protein, putative n=1 Tax=Ricinus communis TaxID=3988 RepID=B9RF90_RICCO|nr:zinc finger protein GAI-ASSOCIATED FACTOR 1 [Ricinus communis]EEF49861.1 nucleic acid binding protein, putative [Ricinus communis]|eukprot:XP_002512409.1 protein indeterminate-domain 2 [Ricinus communis]
MSNITGEGRSFSSGNTAGVGEEVQGQQQELILNHHLNSIANSTTTTTTNTAANSNGSTATQQLQPPPVKKKRNLPGNPDPNAEVIALSPNTLLATNRFVCEICNKGFQRDQNLQLHRRGHNLPWKLKQRTSTEIRKRVYVCPEPSCVHHNPGRALGDLTGIKKHFSRKHGEKKWKCDKCSKKYAVQSDWKAHAKTCGTKEYKCDCGTIFSRRDSFITHRAFCDALTEENNKGNQGLAPNNIGQSLQVQVTNLMSMPINNSNNQNSSEDQSSIMSNFNHVDIKIPLSLPHELMPTPAKLPSGTLSASSTASLLGGARTAVSNSSSSSSSLQLNASSASIFERKGNLASSASMSATALLQKAAQMGATASSNNLNYPMTHKSFVITSMAPSTFASVQTQNDQIGSSDGYVSQFFNANEGMFNGVLDHQDSALFKIQGQESSNNKSFFGNGGNNQSGLSRFSGDVMTVDFLGVGGSRKRSIHEVQQKPEMEFIGIGHHPLVHFEQQAALEKPVWDI